MCKCIQTPYCSAYKTSASPPSSQCPAVKSIKQNKNANVASAVHLHCTLLWSAELGTGREIWLGLNRTLSCHQYPWILMNKLLVLHKGILEEFAVEKEELSTMAKIRSAVLSHH